MRSPKVLVSLGLQYAIAILFWLAGYMDQLFVPTFWHYSPAPLSIGLTNLHHQNCLWSQLVFCLSLSLAGLVRQVQRREHVDAFESASIPTIIPIPICCLVLVTVSYLSRKEVGDKPMEKKAIFTATYALALVSGGVAMFGSFWAPRTDRILAECEVFATENNVEWREVALPPMRESLEASLTMIVVLILTVICSISAWYVLQRNMHTWERKSFRKKFFVVVIGLLSVFHMLVIGSQFSNIFYAKAKMEILWNSEAGQTDWTIGQIGALFSWAPLTVDMVHSVVRQRGD